ncbi:DUF5801 repeats-in-toxin domain-containing protein, partial [uncultured Roseibium sp.]|uniref:DUF5801 repeats-in-toxin domain-containing protein n=1 Tax=uncultured Roseibium sp. TaxID=1936171 RepID=UPI00345DF6D4
TGVASIETVTWTSETTNVGTTVWTAKGDASGDTVATLTVGNDGSYSFVQSAPLVHGSDDATESDDLDLTFMFRVTDGDGDTANSKLTVSIDDDTPVVSNPGGSAPGVSNAVLDEDDILVSGDQPAGTDGGVASDQRVATGNLRVDFGADGFKSTAFSGAFVVPNENSDTLVAGGPGIDSGLTSDGRPIFFVLSADGQTLSGVTPGGPGLARETIFTAELNDSDAGYTVTLLGNIDHQAPDGVPGGRDEGQSINLTVVATDGDDDTLDVTLSIRIVDDAPVVSNPGGSAPGVSNAVLDEDDILVSGDQPAGT